MPAGPGGIDADPLPHRHAGDLRSRLGDLAGEFVPGHQGLADHEVADPAVEEIVEVGAADPAGTDPDADLAGSERQVGALLEPQILGGMKDTGTHGVISLRSLLTF